MIVRLAKRRCGKITGRIKNTLIQCSRIVGLKKTDVAPIVLCRPQGGFNDMLCQIEKCYRYSRMSGRRLWIDTSRSGFLDGFENYFESHEEFSYGNPSEVYFDETCFPECLSWRLNSYQPVFSAVDRNHVDQTYETRLSFRFSRAYRQTVLVHEQCGGGNNGIHFLKHLSLREPLRTKIITTIDSLGDYDAIHVRNTDYQTNYKDVFDFLKPCISGGLVVCTDDYRCQQYAKGFWSNQLKVIHEIPDTAGKPLHMNPHLDRYTTNCTTLLDLFILAKARNFYTRETSRGVLSGFARLVIALRSDQKTLARILGS